MPTTTHKNVSDLSLDLENFRTVRQADEEHAVTALIAIKPDRFWALMESLLEDGYSPTENIIVLKSGNRFIVKEGNRRIASLKLIHGLVQNIELPENIQKEIDAVTAVWKTANTSVPCAIYPASEKSSVDKLVSRTHAKGELAGRDRWPAVATARYARDHHQRVEPGLDLLEKYLSTGRNLKPEQAERWSGDYPITVLDEAIQKLKPLLGFSAGGEIAANYPKKHRKPLEGILYDIGISQLGFKELRSASWVSTYGLQPATSGSAQTGGAQTGSTVGATGTQETESATGSANGGSDASARSSSSQAHASNDPKSVRKKLREFKVRGKGREKIVTLFNEIKTLKLEEHPHAFCFLLRSIFELSAKAYCADHKKSGGPDARKKDGTDKPLADLLREITLHLTGNGTDKAKVRSLHGPMAELAKKDGMLSVTSLNQLIHNSSFSVAPSDISILFGNAFPLLEEMNG